MSLIFYVRKLLPYTNGIPSDDSLRRYFRVLDPKVFEDRFEQWISYVFAAIGIAGKVIHVVSAFVGEIGELL